LDYINRCQAKDFIWNFVTSNAVSVYYGRLVINVEKIHSFNWGSASMGAGTGILLIDFIVRPLLKFSFKFYCVGFLILFLVYGYIAYQALKSSYISDQNTW